MRLCGHVSPPVVDELGCLDVGKEGAGPIFQLASRRCPLARSTTVTASVGVGRWGEVFGDAVTASAVADRLCHHCTLIRITGRSYRLKGLELEEEASKD